MAQSDKPKKLFKVASEFNVSTSSIVEALSDNGYEVDNKPNTKITPEMYGVLEEAYGVDKERSQEHERAREEYETRRTEIHSKRNESVTVESFLEPLDEGEEEEEDLPLQPEDSGPEMDLEPVEEDQEEAEAEEKAEEETEAEAEQEEAEEAEAAAEETEEETASEEPAAEEQETEAADEATEEAEAKAQPEQKEEKKEEAKAESSEEAEEKDTGKKEEAEKAKEETAGKKADEKEKEAETTEAKADKADKTSEKASSKEKEEKKQAAEDKSEDKKKQAASADKDDQKKDDQSDDEEEEEEGVIRGRAGKLKGTKVVGKVDINRGDDSKRKKRKKRKRKGGKSEDDSDSKRSDKSNKGRESGKGKSRKKRKKRKRRRRVDEEDVEQKMKETMQRMQQSEGVGRKRQKRRRQRREEREEELQQQQELEELEQDIIEVSEFVTVSDLADLLDVNATDVITTCMNLGMMVSINQRLDASTIELVADEYDKDVEFVDAEEMMEEIETEDDDPEDLEPRAPVITVMGHVDHGKTSLLDYIRKTKVASGEAGGITQHVGAYEIITDEGRNITFLDTPGHEAFTAMRSRGAQATDIVILVVAADDAVMPQTIEAINHAKAAGVPIIVAINKVDKPEANTDKIKQQLAEQDVIVEEYGGKHQSAEVSAKTGYGIEGLLEKVLIEAELLELKANPDRRAEGIVLESKIDKGKGTVANVLIQKGTLRVGDPFVAGPCFGRVRAMEDEFGERVQEAGPSKPVQLMGFDDMPQAGDRLVAFDDEKKAKDIASQRQQIKREQDLRKTKHMSLDDISRRMALGEISELNIIIKADVDGSIEALSGSLQKLSNDEVAVNIIHTGVGAITESDVMLASASDGIIIGFQVRPTPKARKLAEEEEIDIRLFSVIYDAVDEVRDALEGMLSPEIREEVLGNAEVRDTFKVPNVGMIAGCYVTDGKIVRNGKVRLVRDGVVIYEGEIGNLKRFKDDVKEVQSGYECGLNIEGYNDVKVGDVIEAYRLVEEKRKLVTDAEKK